MSYDWHSCCGSPLEHSLHLDLTKKADLVRELENKIADVDLWLAANIATCGCLTKCWSCKEAAVMRLKLKPVGER